MKLDVSRVDVWVAGLKDRPGALAEKLARLADARANLEFVLARRSPEKPAAGVVFLAPLKGPAQLKAAKAAGLRKTHSLNSVRVEGPDKPGAGAKVTRALADAGINLRGLSAAVMKKRFVLYLAFDSPADRTKAMRVLNKM